MNKRQKSLSEMKSQLDKLTNSSENEIASELYDILYTDEGLDNSMLRLLNEYEQRFSELTADEKSDINTADILREVEYEFYEHIASMNCIREEFVDEEYESEAEVIERLQVSAINVIENSNKARNIIYAYAMLLTINTHKIAHDLF